MSEEPPRSKRIRKPRRLFDSENDEGQGLGYGQAANARARTQHGSEQRCSQQPQLDSKLLVKFINSANKRLREWQAQMRRKEMESMREPVAVRDHNKGRDSEGVQRGGGDGRGGKGEGGRKNKQLIYFKGSNSSALPTHTEDMLRQFQSLTHESAAVMRKLEKGVGKAKGEPAPGKKAGGSPVIDAAQLKAAKVREQLERARLEKWGEKPHPMGGGEQRGQRVREAEERLELPASDMMNNKVFKRSSYHVAIAYHIYIKQKSEGGPLMNEVDPTLQARRLKEGFPKEH